MEKNTLNDFKLTELITLRDYFIELRSNYINPDYGVTDKIKYDILQENIEIIDSFIVRSFQVIKFDTELPVFFTKESLDKARKDREDYNNQI